MEDNHTRLFHAGVHAGVHAGARRSAGFTLIEIMAVVIIMGLLMGLVGVTVFNQVDKARVATARAQMKMLSGALEQFRLDSSRYPTTEQGLISLVEKPTSGPEPRDYPRGGYLRNVEGLVDPWGEPYGYESPGQHNPHFFDLWSLGADQKSGGEEIDTDIGNWSEQSQG